MMKYTNILNGLLWVVFTTVSGYSQTAMTHIYGRNTISLNGEWAAITDPGLVGNYLRIWEERVPETKTDFVEYSFEGAPKLIVPSDFNWQYPELKFFEGYVWYQKNFSYQKNSAERLFLYFGAVNYLADVYLNGVHIGSHEGGFTPFEFEITETVKDGSNSVIVKVDNRRQQNGLPGEGYDWLNCGGITRDVFLVKTPSGYIEDYSIQLAKGSYHTIEAWVKVNHPIPNQEVTVSIPELGITRMSAVSEEGIARLEFRGDVDLWSPENPKLYTVQIASGDDFLEEAIGFRTIEIKGKEIHLNGKPIFLRGVNIHEENPVRAARASTYADAELLLRSARELGCNFVRLVHYPHNEHIVRLAEKMGLMVWDEIPVYQHIAFSSEGMQEKLETVLTELISRDRNRCAVIFWCLSNETYTSTEKRSESLVELTRFCRTLDSTRLITSVLSNQGYQDNTFDVWDPLVEHCDVIAINEYLGWYLPFSGEPSEVKWKLNYPEKPLIITEFGGEAKYGSDFGPKDEAAWWSEEYQEKIYTDQIRMFNATANLSGVCPWTLFDYQSTSRLHPVFQGGYNRKGLLSEQGDKKKAWYIMKDYYGSKKQSYMYD
ncbi:MAG: glycoside hydrolase family 2 [Tannerellaceae bacterium]|nr:glycoside hydrolase family 2 [Tannerellaceae bacterium]